MEKVNWCCECKHYTLNNAWTDEENKKHYAVCSITDVVNGVGYEECRHQRLYGFFFARVFRQCGKEGRYWEPKK